MLSHHISHIYTEKQSARTAFHSLSKKSPLRGWFKYPSGRPLDRSNIRKEMKALCAAADVPPAKVFPHNLRHLFARTFYRAEKDLLRLADLPGHSRINTTRIYTMDTGAQHRRALDRVGAMLCAT